MKKPLLFLSLFCFVTVALFGQQVVSIKLDESNNYCHNEPLRYANGNISVCATFADNDDHPILSITLENNDEEASFIIFGHSWSRKELRKARIIDKTSNNRDSETAKCDHVSSDQELAPSEEYQFPSFDATCEEENIIRIPFYIAKQKKRILGLWKRTVLYEKQIVELNITVEPKVDANFLDLQQDVEALCRAFQNDIDNHKFCSNPAHNPSLKNQTKVYVEQRDELRRRIERTRIERGWSVDSRQFKKYQELLAELDRIDPETIHYDCGRHTHSCQYCNLSLEDIYRRLENYYKSIYSGATTKAEVWADVNRLYNCYANSTRNSARRNESRVVKDGIVKYYNLIKKMQ